ncbi:hypothetical protein BaRGS_00002872, partial [Batillaria attramentaria]
MVFSDDKTLLTADVGGKVGDSEEKKKKAESPEPLLDRHEEHFQRIKPLKSKEKEQSVPSPTRKKQLLPLDKTVNIGRY